MRQSRGEGRGGRSGARQPGGGRGEAGPKRGGKGPNKGPNKAPNKGPNKGPRGGPGHRGKAAGKRFEERLDKRADKRTGNARHEDRRKGPRGKFAGHGDGRPKRYERSERPERASRPPVEAAPPPPPPRKPPPAFEASTGVQTVFVTADENNMRLDRFFEARFPGLSFSHIQRIIRKGEVRVNGKRSEPKARIEKGHAIRIPPLKLEKPEPREDAPAVQKDRAFIASITLYEDEDVMVLNKPMGLAVQGGSGTTRHIDGILEALKGAHRDAQRPRLVHRLDKDTSGCLLIAKTRFAAAALGESFRQRSTRKYYWALVAGVPKPKQGRISTFLAKEDREDENIMRIAKHGEEDASHAVTYYAVVETAAQKLAWLSLKPVTGRTHQLRVHMAHVKNPIVGDPKYFNIENWEFPGGIQNKLHLLARRIVVPHPRGYNKFIDVTAPLPDHMQQSWNLLGFDVSRYDPIEDAPDED